MTTHPAIFTAACRRGLTGVRRRPARTSFSGFEGSYRMDARSLDYIAAACAGEPLSGRLDRSVSRVCTDSRLARGGDLFVALRGDRFDGHQFTRDAVGRGAQAVLVEREKAPKDLGNCAVIAVTNTTQALGRLAARYRGDFSLPVVAVGGSNGKTTTKELVAAVLRQKLQVLWSEASFNNQIGVPLTLLRLERQHQAAVVEVGTNHPGELAPLLQMVQPTLGILTCIGREHLEFFGDLAGVVREEGMLAEMLPPGGKLFLNGDHEWTAELQGRCRASVVQVGFSARNDWRANVTRMDLQGIEFRVEAPLVDYAGDYRLPLVGRHQALNALFALAVGAELGLSRSEIQAGLAGVQAPSMRLQLWDWNGAQVLDDAYNANADSMLAALQTLKELPCKGRRLAVLGDMAELGSHGEAAHAEVGRRVAELGIGQLFAVGAMANVMGRAARAAGLNRVLEFHDVQSATAAVKAFLRPGDLLLLKASRAVRLEQISDALKKS